MTTSPLLSYSSHLYPALTDRFMSTTQSTAMLSSYLSQLVELVASPASIMSLTLPSLSITILSLVFSTHSHYLSQIVAPL